MQKFEKKGFLSFLESFVGQGNESAKHCDI